MPVALEGLRTVIYPSPDLEAAKAWWTGFLAAAVATAIAEGASEHAPATDVGGGIVTATVRTPSGAILGLIHNPHFEAT
ncbi:MAG: hypothetical protein M3387_00365 [Actinomycetota bacterium]|nr:hypothetical protein [Actinomycetota bacterium]